MTNTPLVTVSEKAKAQLKDLLKQDPSAIAIRISHKTKGCSGNVYDFAFAKEILPTDEEVIVGEGLRLLVHKPSLMFILGTHIDYTSDDLLSEFTFKNPNATGNCGCGKSFHI